MLHANPADPFEMPQTAFGGFCRNDREIGLEHQFIEIRVPPAPIVERLFGAGIGGQVFLGVPLVFALSGDASKLPHIQARLDRWQVAKGAVIAK